MVRRASFLDYLTGVTSDALPVRDARVSPLVAGYGLRDPRQSIVSLGTRPRAQAEPKAPTRAAITPPRAQTSQQAVAPTKTGGTPAPGKLTIDDIGRIAREAGFDEEGARVAMAIAATEGGLEGAVGDNGQSFGPFQFYRGGQLPAYAASLGLDPAQAGQYAIRNPAHAADWALQGYLGQKIREGMARGLFGPALAEYAQRYGQVSVSPERAASWYRQLFG